MGLLEGRLQCLSDVYVALWVLYWNDSTMGVITVADQRSDEVVWKIIFDLVRCSAFVLMIFSLFFSVVNR
jgi:protein-S-isoprenylcysteine O-methyltransferase Ste14